MINIDMTRKLFQSNLIDPYIDALGLQHMNAENKTMMLVAYNKYRFLYPEQRALIKEQITNGVYSVNIDSYESFSASVNNAVLRELCLLHGHILHKLKGGEVVQVEFPIILDEVSYKELETFSVNFTLNKLDKTALALVVLDKLKETLDLANAQMDYVGVLEKLHLDINIDNREK